LTAQTQSTHVIHACIYVSEENKREQSKVNVTNKTTIGIITN